MSKEKNCSIASITEPYNVLTTVNSQEKKETFLRRSTCEIEDFLPQHGEYANFLSAWSTKYLFHYHFNPSYWW